MRRSRIRLCVAAGVIYFSSAAAAEPAPPAAAVEPSPGEWVEHRYSFVHLGFTSTYSCDGLADKLAGLLRAAGARPDVEARGFGCAAGFGRPSKLASASLRFYTLRPVAPAVAADPATGAPGTVDGVWRSVAFEPRKPYDLDHGDCELVEEFRNWLLPMFTTRGIDDQLRCIPNSVSAGDLRFRFEAFAPLPPPKAVPKA